MKLLMTADAVGGVWQYATDLAGALRHEGVETVLALLGPVPSADQRRAVPDGITLLETGLPLDWLADGPAPVREAAERLAGLAREIDADLVQLNSPSLAAAACFPCPVIAVAHGCIGTWWDAAGTAPLPDSFHWQVAMTRAGLTAADAVVAPTAAYATTVQRRYGLERPPVAIHNGRAPQGGIGQGAPADHVFTAGRLWDRVKNTPLLDAVAARLPVPFRAAGATTAPHGESVATKHLRHLGTIGTADLAAELACRPIFVSAASFEPFGLAVLEAAQAGCALVLADIASFRELWNGAAMFVDGWDADRWAAAIMAVRADPARREVLGREARDRAAHHTPAAAAAAMARLYADLLPRRRMEAA